MPRPAPGRAGLRARAAGRRPWRRCCCGCSLTRCATWFARRRPWVVHARDFPRRRRMPEAESKLTALRWSERLPASAGHCPTTVVSTGTGQPAYSAISIIATARETGRGLRAAAEAATLCGPGAAGRRAWRGARRSAPDRPRPARPYTASVRPPTSSFVPARRPSLAPSHSRQTHAAVSRAALSCGPRTWARPVRIVRSAAGAGRPGPSPAGRPGTRPRPCGSRLRPSPGFHGPGSRNWRFRHGGVRLWPLHSGSLQSEPAHRPGRPRAHDCATANALCPALDRPSPAAAPAPANLVIRRPPMIQRLTGAATWCVYSAGAGRSCGVAWSGGARGTHCCRRTAQP